MAWQYSHHVLPLVAAAVLSALLSAAAWRHRERTGARYLVALGLANVWWASAYAAGLAATDLGVEMLAYKLMYPAVGVVPVAWVAFAAEYTGRIDPLDRRRIAALLVVPAAMVAMVWTNELHGLVWVSVEQVAAGPLLVATTTHGPGFWVFAAYAYLVLAVGSGLVLQMVVLSDHLYRVQAAALTVAVLLPWASNALYLSGLTGIWDLTTLAFAASCAILLGSILRRQLLQMVPVAREVARNELIDSMAEAVIVVDEDSRIADLNPAAAELVGRGDGAEAALGSPAAEAFPAISGVVDPGADESRRTEVAIDDGGAERRFEVQSVPLQWGYGTVTGQLLTLRDVTARYERERRLQDQRQRLEVLNRVLRHDIRNGMQAILLNLNRVPAEEPEAERAMASIRHTGQEVMELSESARRFESTISGDVEEKVVDLAELARRIADDYGTAHPDAELRVDLPDRAPAAVNGLAGFALRNVVENAIEHNDRDDPTVEVAVEDGPAVEVRISDDGPGLPPEERSVLERGTESALDHSSGLGLWLVTWVVEDSGGEVRIADNEPRGTTITLAFPPADHEQAGTRAPADLQPEF